MARSKKKSEENMEDQKNEEIQVIVGFISDPVDPDLEADSNDVVIMSEMQKQIAEELALQHVLNRRREEYPGLLEQIQALWLAHKGDDSEFKRVDAIINEVKVRNPKPEIKLKNEEGE